MWPRPGQGAVVDILQLLLGAAKGRRRENPHTAGPLPQEAWIHLAELAMDRNIALQGLRPILYTFVLLSWYLFDHQLLGPDQRP